MLTFSAHFLSPNYSGATATFLGSGDLHDSRFNHLELSADYAAFAGQSENGYADYTGVEIDDQHISYSIRVYPSSHLENDYRTSDPIVFSCAMLAVFLFCVILFL